MTSGPAPSRPAMGDLDVSNLELDTDLNFEQRNRRGQLMITGTQTISGILTLMAATLESPQGPAQGDAQCDRRDPVQAVGNVI